MAEDTTVTVSPDTSTTVITSETTTDTITISDIGVAGPPNVLTIGTVTYGDLAVTITGTSPSQTLNFVLPGATSWTHIQSSPSASWTITHNLGYYPGGVSVVDSGGNTCLGDIQYISTNVLVVNFVAAFSGSAYIS